MAETVNQETQAGSGAESEKTFTQTELDAIVGDRLKRERAKYADYDDLKAKATKYDQQQDASKTELQKEQERNAAIQKELDQLKKQNSITEARTKVSKETGVPVECLSGEDEASCKAQAEAIMAYAKKPSSYPGVHKDTPPKSATGSSGANNEAMREFARQLFGH